ncbi:MAG: type II and III secretion system protein family protein [Thiobacillus sp.]|jgi:pilus assembly protein CpaC|uniref:type II and III secretion system protein family protein n=1 Tax=Thiobacillus sp. TaxID=924 RepID=UPI0028959576|nr:type II and III secretion system protein family protein [Thiobacillus sp.]MDT3708249.1 type II and III secretion system protein family protein [Thiobacillus sp.]
MNTKRQGLTALLGALVLFTAGGAAAAEKTVTPAAVKNGQVASASTEIAPPINLVIGKSTILRLPAPAARISVGNPVVADINLINPREAYLLGKEIGSTNLIIWTRDGVATVIDITVNVDTANLESQLHQLMPGEQDIRVSSAADSIVLQGTVSDVAKVDQAISIAEAYVRKFNRSLVSEVKMPGKDQAVNISLANSQGGAGNVRVAGARIINMLRVSDPQQVMLEVKVAEVSKTLLDKLGAEFKADKTNGDWTYSLVSNFLFKPGLGGTVGAAKSLTDSLKIEAEKQDGLVKILAEPNIMAISGQTGKFLAGGRIFIPVSNTNTGGLGIPTITLEEKEFGVRLAFTPTVLEGGRINLKVAPEVSELSQTGSPFATVNGETAVLPSFTVRNAETTIQLNDGQSFAIAGLIKNNVTETVKRYPVLGEVPIIGALFRSSEFQSDRTELLFVVTPRLAKPLSPNYALPTDHYHQPGRAGYFLGGQMEGAPSDSDAPESTTGIPAVEAAKPQPAGGFEMR